MIDIKAHFIGYVLAQLTDAYLRELAVELLEHVPEPFWTAPTSSSGKYHPDFALHENGLVRHTVAVMFIAKDLCVQNDLTGLDRDIVMLAAAMHDTYKGGDYPIWGYAKDHADIAACKILEKRSYSRTTEQQESLVQVTWAVRQHMSMWGMHPLPVRKMDVYYRPASAVVATADYIASRKYFLPTGELDDLLTTFTAPDKEES